MAENLREIEYCIPEGFHGNTVEAFLRIHDYSRAILCHLRSTEGLRLNGNRTYLKQPLAAGDRLLCRILETEDSPHVVETEIPLSVVYEDEDLLIINKPAGLPIHPSMGHYEYTLGNALCWYMHHVLHYDHYVNRIVNRLDKNTSGLLIAAKNMLAAARLGEMIRRHEIRREYLAVAVGDLRHPAALPGVYSSSLPDPLYAAALLRNEDGSAPHIFPSEAALRRRADSTFLPEASSPEYDVCGMHFTVNAPIGRKADSVVERVIDYVQGDYAVTHGMLLSYNEEKDLTLLRLRLETGRTHQIRVHMKYLGHPLPGDFLYNADDRYISRQPLHAWRLRFCHPMSGKLLQLTAPLPEDMLALL